MDFICVAQRKVVSFSPSNVAVLYFCQYWLPFCAVTQTEQMCVYYRIRYHISKWNLFLSWIWKVLFDRLFLIQMSRLFVEDCTRYREYIHLLSFNYDFHLCKAQLYLNGSQRIFNKGYGVTAMLKGLLEEYPQCPLFARNRVCAG